MAPRFKHTVYATRSSTRSKAKSNVTRTSKPIKVRKETSKTSAPSSRKTAKSAVARLENGFVDLSKTPKNVLAIAERNAGMSPLLRLPGEIRNKIWEFAMGRYYVNIKEVVHSKTATSLYMKVVGCVQISPTDDTPQAHAFHLPEVSRQVYSETATLGYKLNTFIIDFDMARNKEYMEALLPGQREAITTLMPETHFFEAYVEDLYRKPLVQMFPNLNRIEVPGDALRLILMFDRFIVADFKTSKEWETFFAQKIKEKEGGGVQVTFHEEQKQVSES